MLPADLFLATLSEWIEVFMRRSMGNFILYSKESGLSMSQIGALFRIFKGASSVTDVGDDLGISSAAASQMLEHLVQLHLILRTEDPHDRRFKQIVLTDKGRQTLQDCLEARQGWLKDMANTLNPGEKQQIVAALKVLIDKARQPEHVSALDAS